MLAARIKKARKNWTQWTQGTRPVVYIGCATCGLAAGAGDLLAMVGEELRCLEIKAHVIFVGCIGMCFMEPLVDIWIPGQPRICYG